MATAMAFPETKQGKRNDLFPEETSLGKEYSRAALSKARYVLRNNPTAEGKMFPEETSDVGFNKGRR